MAKESEGASAPGVGLDRLKSSLGSQAAGRPPLHLWNPPFCGDIDMRIARDGTWFYNGSPIGRPALVRLFASVLRKDDGKYVLVTPVEKVGITVDDAPFLGVEMVFVTQDVGPVLMVRTNVDDWVRVDAEHRLEFEPGDAGGLKPYVHVRDGLRALLTRALFFDLVERGEARALDGTPMFGIASAGLFFSMGDAREIGFDP